MMATAASKGTAMPGNPRPVTDERDNLITWLAQQRDVLKLTAFGLTDDEARVPAPPSTLTVGGLIKHVAQTEEYWIKLVNGEKAGSEGEYADGFTLLPDETLAGVMAYYDEVAAITEKTIANIADLGQPVPVPRDAPWFPKDVDAWSVRWVLVHIMQETSRHAGHADMVRERVDGATAYPLMAAAEGWPETAWLKPWKRAADA
jgi:uncharacterized damage-inducible protein DinB